jgi:hypothetical protein
MVGALINIKRKMNNWRTVNPASNNFKSQISNFLISSATAH